MTDSLDDLLAPLEARLKAATPGVWEPRDAILDFEVVSRQANVFIAKRMTVADAHLIAHAPTDIARLVKALRVADAALKIIFEIGNTNWPDRIFVAKEVAAEARAEVRAALEGK